MSIMDYRNVLRPWPREMSQKPGQFHLDPALCVATSFNDATPLAYWLSQLGLENRPVYEYGLGGADILRMSLGRPSQKVAPTLNGDDAYALEINVDGITLAARTFDGLTYGLRTLCKLLIDNRRLPLLSIQDAPVMDFRGVHLCLFNPNDGTQKEDTGPEAIKRMMRLAAMSGYKYVFLESWGVFPFCRHPYATWPNTTYSRAVFDDLISFARNDLHIQPIPAQNLTSHAGWSRIASRKHVVLDQRPDLVDMWIPGGWCFATENPTTKIFLRDVMEELLEAYRQPAFLHAGCDKCFGFGSSEADRTRNADLLFGNHISSINSFLQERGTRMIMWADMLYSSMDALYWKCQPALTDMLARNIVMNLWTHNDPGQHWADVDFFEKKGFQTIYSPWIDTKGVRSMGQACIANNSFGILQTTWHKPQSAASSVAYSGFMQWEGRSPESDDCAAFVEQWYRA